MAFLQFLAWTLTEPTQGCVHQQYRCALGCFQAECQALGTDTESVESSGFCSCRSKQNTLHFLKFSLEMHHLKNMAGEGHVFLGQKTWILIIQSLVVSPKWKLLGAKTFQGALSSDDVEWQQWKGNNVFLWLQKEPNETRFSYASAVPSNAGRAVSYLLIEFLLRSQMASVRPEGRHRLENVI